MTSMNSTRAQKHRTCTNTLRADLTHASRLRSHQNAREAELFIPQRIVESAGPARPQHNSGYTRIRRYEFNLILLRTRTHGHTGRTMSTEPRRER
jgi:hypothetical protein